MNRIMDDFQGKLNRYSEKAMDYLYSVEFHSEQYPPRLEVREREEPLFVDANGECKYTDPMTITIIGLPETRIEIKGKSQIGKTLLNKFTNDGVKIINLYLHGYMQEQKDREALRTEAAKE